MKTRTIAAMFLLLAVLPAFASTQTDRDQYAKSVSVWATEHGMPVNVWAVGTELHICDDEVATDVGAYRWHKQYVSPNWGGLKALGFTTVILTNRVDTIHTWNLAAPAKK